MLSRSLLVLGGIAALVATVTSQTILSPSDPQYNNLPPTDPNAGLVNPRSTGSSASERALTSSACCPGGLPPRGCTGSRCYPTNCAPVPGGCNCNAPNLCPLPLDTGFGDHDSEGKIRGKLRNIVRDPDLYYSLACLNQQDFGPSVLGGCGDSYDEQRIPNKIKVFINWVDDIGNSLTGQLSPSFPTHLGMARRYGVSDLEIQRMMAFIAPYVGFDKTFAGFGAWLGQYANCSILQPHPNNPNMLMPTVVVGVGSPLEHGCPKGQCHNGPYTYTGWMVDSYSKTVDVAGKVVSFYRDQGYSELMLRELTRAWKMPNLSLKSKLYGVLTIDSQYRASPKQEIQGLVQLMMDEKVTTEDELKGFIDFSSCYTGYNRAQAEYHRLFDTTDGPNYTAAIAITAVITAVVITLPLGVVLFMMYRRQQDAGAYQKA